MLKILFNIRLFNGHFDNYFSYLMFLPIPLVIPTAWSVGLNFKETFLFPHSGLSCERSEYEQDT